MIANGWKDQKAMHAFSKWGLASDQIKTLVGCIRELQRKQPSVRTVDASQKRLGNELATCGACLPGRGLGRASQPCEGPRSLCA
jgi:hypothetical protein